MAQATYTKLRDGSWGLRGIGLTANADVNAVKRDGSTKTERVGRVLWTGDDGTQLAEISRGGHYDGDKFNGYGARRGGYRKVCVSDGNCSSMGSGRSCGGYDCDGF